MTALRGLRELLFGKGPGWFSRVYVAIGALSMWSAVTSPWWLSVPITLIWAATYNLVLSSVYFRGQTAAYVEMTNTEPSELMDQFEMHVNAKLVALEDLKRIGVKYGIPAEELQSVVDRGF